MSLVDILELYENPYVVRVTGDCPLIDPLFIDKQIQAMQIHDGDQTWLATHSPILEGQGVHSTSSLKKIAQLSNHPDDLEHVGSRYLAEHPEQFRLIGMYPPKMFSEAKWRVTVDEAVDYEMMQQLYGALFKGYPISLTDALTWMDEHPDLVSQNQAVQHSAINQELAAKRRAWLRHVDLFCDWENPRVIISEN